MGWFGRRIFCGLCGVLMDFGLVVDEFVYHIGRLRGDGVFVGAVFGGSVLGDL